VGDFQYALQHELGPGKAQTDTWGIDFSAAFTPGGSNRNAARTATDIGALGNRCVNDYKTQNHSFKY